MKVGAFAKVGTVAASLAMITSGFIATSSAMADPAATPAVNSQTLAGFGSDTTQDVMNEIAKTINTGKANAWLASYDALGATTVQAKPGGALVPRANGSGEGFKLLQVAKGTLGSSAVVSGTTKSSLTTTTADAAGQVDFARSSGNGSGANASGIWSYVPFAKDAVTGAVNGTDAAMKSLSSVLYKGSSADDASKPSLYSIYHCLAQYVDTNASGAYVGVSGTSTLLAGATKATMIKPVLPAYGSGTRKYFVGLFGYTDSATLVDPTNQNTSCIADTYAGQGINEHDGTAIKGIGAGAIGPFSIPQFVAQSKAATTGVVDRRNGVTLLNELASAATGGSPVTDPTAVGVASVAPTTGTGASLATNVNFPEKRIMYNVLPFGKLADTSTREYTIFNGKNSLVCQATAAITKMGFIPLNTSEVTPSSVEDCGYTGNRFGASTVAAPATLAGEFQYVKAATANQTVDLTVDGNQEAGTAGVYSSDDSYASAIGTAAVGANDFRGTYNWAVPSDATAGTVYSFKGDFTPTDLSVFTASAKSSIVTVKAVEGYTVTLNDIPARVATGASVAVQATVAAAGANTTLVGGWVSLVDDAGNVLGSTYLPKRATVANLSWVATAGTTNLRVQFDPANSADSLTTFSTYQDVYAAAASTKVTATGTNFAPKVGYFGKVSTASNSLTRKITVSLAKSGALTPTGTIKVLISTGRTGGTLLSTSAVAIAANGTATISLPMPNKWRVTGTAGGVDRYLNVVYSGDSNFYGVTASLKVSVTS